MQKTTKAIVVGLSVLLAAGIFASCNKSGSAGANVDKELAKEFKDYKVEKNAATKKGYDFGGMDVHLNNHWDNPNGRTTNPETPAQELEARFFNYLGQVYNMKVDAYGGLGSWGEWPELIANYCTTGGDENYMFIADARSLGAGIKANLFYDWSKSKDIDWNAKKWDSAIRERGTKGNSFYAVRGIASEPRNGVFFNKRLLREAGVDPDSIYDMQKNGTWTWDTMEDVMKKVTRDIDNDGVIDVWGFACNDGYLGTDLALTNGAAPVYKDASGKYVNGFGDEKMIEAMEYSQKIYKLYHKPQPEGSNWDWFFSAFKNAEIAFVFEQEWTVSTWADMADDWGFVCFPYGPHGEKKYQNISDDWYVIIPAIYGDEKAGKIAKIYDFYTEPVPGLAEDVWKDDYYVKFRDERAVDETLQYMRDAGVSNLGGDVPGLEQGHYWWNVVPGWQTPQEGYEATKNEFDSLIAAMNN